MGNSEQLQPHIYRKGFLPVCMDCFKTEKDAIHTGFMPEGIHTIIGVTDPGIDKSNIDLPFDICHTDVSKFTVMQPATDDDPPELPPFEDLLDTAGTDANTAPLDTTSDGMNGIVRHDPTCKCGDCMSQVGADSVRRRHILGEKGHYLTGAESVEASLKAEQQVVINLIKDPQGNDYPDWLDRVDAHIQDLRRKMELFRVQEAATFKVRASKLTADMKEAAERLTPEELAEFKKNHEKNARSSKPPKPVMEETVADLEKQLNKVLKKRDKAKAALEALGLMSAEQIISLLASQNKEAEEIQAKIARKTTPTIKTQPRETTERLSKRKRAIEDLVNAGLSREIAEKMVPNA